MFSLPDKTTLADRLSALSPLIGRTAQPGRTGKGRPDYIMRGEYMTEKDIVELFKKYLKEANPEFREKIWQQILASGGPLLIVETICPEALQGPETH